MCVRSKHLLEDASFPIQKNNVNKANFAVVNLSIRCQETDSMTMHDDKHILHHDIYTFSFALRKGE